MTRSDVAAAGRPVAMITGASRGIGRAIAIRFAAGRTPVALLARDGDGLAGTLAAVRGAGGEGECYVADVTDGRSVSRVHDRVVAELGPVGVLINNAGVVGPAGPLWEVDPDEWWATQEVNVRGSFNCARAVLPGMVRRRDGRIVNLASNAGAHRWPNFSAYAMSKAAVIKLTENLAAETREHGIAVFAVHPGIVRAGFSDRVLDDGPEPADPLAARVRAWFRRQRAEGRTVSAEEAAELVFKVASGVADPLSGRYLTIEDDLDELVRCAEDVRRRNLQVLKVERLRSPP